MSKRNEDILDLNHFRERKLTQTELDELQDQVDKLKLDLKLDRDNVQYLLRWITTATKEDLQFVEDHYIKRDVLKSLMKMLKNPVVYVYESSTDEHGGN